MAKELLHHPAADGNGASRPPIVFVHGSFCAAPIWEATFMPWFAKAGYDCYAPSLRGHGDTTTDMPLPFLSLSDYVDDVAGVVEDIGRTPILVGHSLGGLIVQKYLEREGTSSPAAVLMNSVPPSGLASSMAYMAWTSPGLLWDLSRVMTFGPDAMSVSALRDLLLTRESSPALLVADLNMFQSESMRILQDASWMDLPRQPISEEIPCLVMGGDADAILPVSAFKETAKYHKADLEILRGGPHALMIDEKYWEQAARTLKYWLDRNL